MPSFDRVVEIGPPRGVGYVLTADAIARHNPVEDGAAVNAINLQGEAAFATAGGLIAWYDFDNAVTVTQARFQAATRFLLRAPAGPGGFATGDRLRGGTVAVSVSEYEGAPVPLYSFAIASGEVDANGLYVFGLSDYQWLYPAGSYVNRAIAITEATAHDLRFLLSLTFDVVANRVWARLDTATAFDAVVQGGPGYEETRRYVMRHTAAATPLAELVEAGVRWRIVGIEPEGRRRTLNVDVQRTVGG